MGALKRLGVDPVDVGDAVTYSSGAGKAEQKAPAVAGQGCSLKHKNSITWGATNAF